MQPGWIETTVDIYLEFLWKKKIKLYRPVLGHAETWKAIQALAGDMEGAL